MHGMPAPTTKPFMYHTSLPFSISALLIVLSAASSSLISSEATTAETPAQNEARMAPWRAARFGMFIHWGPISLKGTEIGWSRGNQVPIEVYDNLYKEFNPVKFDAAAWVAVAKAAGMKYVVLTTKHHDGFCLWDTKQTDYKIMNSPFKRDVTKELAEACRKQGLGFGAYYSTCDWHHPDFPVTSPGGTVKREKSDLEAYTAYLKAQTTELVKNYGPLFTVWFDVPQCFDTARGQGVINHLRAIQPNLVINNRTGARGDYDTPEQRIGGFQMQRPWETCMTICQQWAWKPNDAMKPLDTCVRTLLQTIGGDGNLLFNVGPTPEGEIEPRQVERLQEMGAWVAKHAASIYDTRGGPFLSGEWGVSTRAGKRITLFVMHWPQDGRLRLPPIPARILSAATITGEAVEIASADGLPVIVAPPPERRDPIATAIVLELDSPAIALTPVSLPMEAGNLCLGRPAKASNVYNGMETYDAAKAVDSDVNSRWATDESHAAAWLEVDLGAEQRVSRIVIIESDFERVSRFAVQVQEGGAWRDIAGGTTIGQHREIVLPAPVTGRIFRLDVRESSDAPTINEFQLFR